MERSQLDENIQNDMRLVMCVYGRLYKYGMNPNIKKKRILGAWKAYTVFIRGMKKRERNAKKM